MPPTEPTIDDVASAAGTSRSTVSRVINHDRHVRATTRDAVLDAVRALGYAPNRAARSLALTGRPAERGMEPAGSRQATAQDVAAALEDAHNGEDVCAYADLFDRDATWISSTGALLVGRDQLRRHLAQVLPGSLAGGIVRYRVSRARKAAGALVAVIEQEYRRADGSTAASDRRFRHTCVVAAGDRGWTIVAGHEAAVSSAGEAVTGRPESRSAVNAR